MERRNAFAERDDEAICVFSGSFTHTCLCIAYATRHHSCLLLRVWQPQLFLNRQHNMAANNSAEDRSSDGCVDLIADVAVQGSKADLEGRTYTSTSTPVLCLRPPVLPVQQPAS